MGELKTYYSPSKINKNIKQKGNRKTLKAESTIIKLMILYFVVPPYILRIHLFSCDKQTFDLASIILR